MLGKSSPPSAFRRDEVPVLPLNLVCQWPEYRVMEEGDVVLTIEHCAHCRDHDEITHHNEQQYIHVSSGC